MGTTMADEGRPAPATSSPAGPGGDDHPRIAHRPALDGLRGLAVLGVLLFHGDLLRGGFLGVDLFFVLSGYLITALLLVESDGRGRIDLGAFWLRRARRLLPAVFALLAVVAAYLRFVADPIQWAAIRDDGVATLLYVANWHTIASGGAYGADIAGRSPLEHTWSLAIEEQFYVVWPVVVVLLLRVRRSPRVVLAASALVAGVGTALLVGLSFTDVSRNSLYLGTHTRVAAIGFGALVASWEAVRRDRPLSADGRSVLSTAATVAALGVLAGWVTLGLDDDLLYRGGLTACGIGVALVIWSVVQPGSTVLGRVLSLAPLRGLGFVSYGLYLWHWPIFLFLDQDRTGLDGWPLFGVRVVASVAAAVVSYEVLEQPIRRSDWGGRRVALRSGAAASVVVALLVVAAVGAPPSGLGDDSGPRLTRADGAAPVLAVYGDSVAFILAEDGLALRADELGVSILNIGRLGCEPLGGITDARDGNGAPIWGKAWEDCIDRLPTYPDRLDVRPDVSVLLFGGVQWDAEIDGRWVGPCEPAYDDLFRERMGVAIDRLAASGAPVVVVRPAPVLSERLDRLKGIDDGAARATCLWSAVEPLLRDRGVATVDLQAHLCADATRCDEVGTDAENRTDGIHYRGEAAVELGAWLVPAVLRAAAR